MARKTSCMAGASPMISVGSSGACSGSKLRFLLACCSARWVVATASSTSKGLGKYSNAPPWYEATALSKSEWAVVIITGKPGWAAVIRERSFRPSIPGMRISLMMASGTSPSRWPRSSSPFSKQRVMMPAWVRAFSSTQRIDRSSSAIQTELAWLMRRAPGECAARTRYCRVRYDIR